MRVLGIDPGSRLLGYGAVEERRGSVVHLGHGVVRADANAPLESRLHEIFTGLSAAIDVFRPDAVAVEGVFSFRNARSALILGHARGVALLVAAQRHLPVHEYPPAKVKRSVGAGGAAGKDAVARMVSALLRIESPKRADASDALAVAICHLHQGRWVPGKTSKATNSAFSDRLKPSYLRVGTHG